MPENSKIKISDLQGLISLLTDGTVNVTNLVEELNRQIVHPPFLPSSPIQDLITKISGITYNNVRGVTKLIGTGLEKTFAQLNPLLEIGLSFEKKEIILAVLNGIIGDYLNENENPLATVMKFRYQGKTINRDEKSIRDAYPKVTGKILLMVHGLCMNDVLWQHNGHDHGTLLAEEQNWTAIYLQYNSGRHISENGQLFSSILEELINAWPVTVEEVVIVAHSMGGLLSRSAFHYGTKEEQSWTTYLKKMMFLGTPHHGAPLEQVGNYIDHLFDAIPYVKPFARLNKMRSSGITDLRFGSLVEEDWKGLDRFKNQWNKKTAIALPTTAGCYSIAASIGKEEDDLTVRLLGDGLVQVKSALGKHDNQQEMLDFESEKTCILYETNHMDLLSSKNAYNQLKLWLAE